MELISNLRRLPKELVIQIWSYTYSPQSPILLADIRDYLRSLDYIQYYYFDKYMENGFDEYLYWMVHDIFGYIAFFSYDEDRSLYNTFWRRAIQCSQLTLDKLSEYIYRLEHNSVDTQIRLLWGLLYPEERADYIDSIEYFDNEVDEEGEEDFDF
jgi:hypothetical protein